MQSFKKLFFLSISYLLCLNAYSQGFRVKRFGGEDGLPAMAMQTVFQDSQGFIWIGQSYKGGLSRYDGTHFKTFKSDPNSETAISSNDINCIHEDQLNQLYIGTDDGLCIFNKYTETFITYKAGKQKSGLSGNSIKCIRGINSNELLIATDKGLDLFNVDTKKALALTCSNDSVPTDVKHIYTDAKHRVFIASFSNGLYEYDLKSKTLIHYPLKEQLNSGDISKQLVMRCLSEVDGRIWCGTDEGIVVFDPDEKTFKGQITVDCFDYNIYRRRITAFEKDTGSHILWIGTWDGLIKYDLDDKSCYEYKNNTGDTKSLSDDKVLCLHLDKQHNLWIGMTNAGLNVHYASSSKFPLLGSLNGLTNEFVYSIQETSVGEIWVGTESGLFKKGANEAKFSDVSFILKRDGARTVLSLLEDKTGKLWFGTYGQGIVIYDPKINKLEKILGDKNLGGTVLKMIQTKNGTIWVATYGDGLYAIDPVTLKIKRYTKENGLTSNTIYTIYENKEDNTLWIGMAEDGLCILDFKHDRDKPVVTSFKHGETKNTLSSNTVNDIYKDAKGIFWIGTNEGLNRFDFSSKQFTTYIENGGLKDRYIYGVIPDKKGNLWLPTNSGLTKFNPKLSGSDAFRNYSIQDGIQALEFNQGAFFLCRDGKILVGGVAGINYFDPQSVAESRFEPTPFIYSFNRKGVELGSDTSMLLKKYINLKWFENNFSFEMMSIEYPLTEYVKFSYMLEGYDDVWSPPSTMRHVSYSELPGGTYTFKLKCTNSDGEWSSKINSITIHVEKPWWKTWWFYSLILAAVLLMAYSIYVIVRSSQLKKINEDLENKVEERTQELKETNDKLSEVLQDVTASITYAKRLQQAILPPQEFIHKHTRDSFVLYKPKDIVAGDFYWAEAIGDLFFIAAADSTGHGVPGAMVSVICSNALNRAVKEFGLTDTGKILDKTRELVIETFAKSNDEVKDGMDISLLCIDRQNRKIFWSGANNPLWYIQINELKEIKADKQPIGKTDNPVPFTTHPIDFKDDTIFYLFTDGLADQFGGPKGKKFKYKQFENLLTSVCIKAMQQQSDVINETFEEWKGGHEQVDDVLVIGIKV